MFLGTLISTAVLTGALIMGDSVKFSLKHLVDIRLGNTRYALNTGDRFVRADLANEIADQTGAEAKSLLVMQGTGINSDLGTRINGMQVIGIEDGFWAMSDITLPVLNTGECIVNLVTANTLKLKIGDEFLLRVNNADIIPLNAPFVQEESPTVAIRLQVKAHSWQ